ncbi:MAG: AI-2E family transporter, partial [Verrucomicrobiota bacterium]|nr:AI-2E family transporter [Verrucomicrobiota bacterium]
EDAAPVSLQGALGPLVEILATAGLVVVLVIFILLRRLELRNRLIRVVGYARLPTTTKAIDEAANRISRYILMQTLVNSTYGVAIGIGLYFIGLPYALLWGFLAAMVRFIPYVGPWLGALLPISLALAVFPGWLSPLLVIGLFVAIELLSNMFMEPLLYGPTVGVSEVALILAVAFWTWVWGAIGLALAAPLTVCLVVFAKHIPGLSFLGMLMGDEPVMEGRMIYYQRLLAMDLAEAREIVRKYLKKSKPETIYDNILIPSLVYANRDLQQKKLSDEDEEFILKASQEIIDSLPDEQQSVNSAVDQNCDSKGVVLCLPASGKFEEIALTMLGHRLGKNLCHVEVLSANALSGEMIEKAVSAPPEVVCIGSMAPHRIGPAKYLAKRLREKIPGVKICMVRWGNTYTEEKLRKLNESSGSDYFAATIEEAAAQIIQLLQIRPSRAENSPQTLRSELVLN